MVIFFSVWVKLVVPKTVLHKQRKSFHYFRARRESSSRCIRVIYMAITHVILKMSEVNNCIAMEDTYIFFLLPFFAGA